jgi:hypothetical protein
VLLNLRHQAQALLQKTSLLLWVQAGAITTINFAAYSQFLEPYGLGVWHKFLAAMAAVSVGILFWVFFAWLLEVVAFLPRGERAKINPIILAMTGAILLSSSYPHVQIMGGGYAAEIEDKEYVEDAVARADRVKAAARQFGQLGGVLLGGARTLRDLEEREKRGLLSGFDSGTAKPGPVSDWVGGFAARLEATAATVPDAAKAATPIIERIDAAANAMRTAIQDREKEMAARRTAMQAAGDAFRTAAIELAETLPVASISTLGQSLQSDVPLPALSGAAHIRDGQLRAVEAVKRELERIGASIEKSVAALGAAKTEQVPAYNPPPIPVLVVKHASKLLNIIGVALAIDLLGLVLYFFTARINDAMKRRPEDETKALTVAELVRAQEAEALLKLKGNRSAYGLLERPEGPNWLPGRKGDGGAS